MLTSHAGLVLEVFCLMIVASLSNTIYQMQEKNKENMHNMRTELMLLQKWGQQIESTDIGREAMV